MVNIPEPSGWALLGTGLQRLGLVGPRQGSCLAVRGLRDLVHRLWGALKVPGSLKFL
jgi:hypothetical protein